MAPAGWIVGGLPNLPIQHLRIRALWDPDVAIGWKASEPLTGMVEQHSGRKNEVGVVLDNLEPLVQPKLAPARFAQLREVEFSSYRSWAEVSRQLAPLFDHAAQLSASSPMVAEIARIRATSSDPTARAEAALALVQDQIRYVYLGMNDGGLVPADVDLTWTRRFGDCKAKAVLLVALLRGLGIDAQPAAVSTIRGDGLDSKLPLVSWFDHVIVRAEISGKTYWLDGTRSGDRHLANVPDFQYHWALPLVRSGSELVAIPVQPLDVPDSETSLRIDASAGLAVPAPTHVELTVRRDAALAVKRAFANLTSSDADRRMRDFWKKQYDFVDVISVAQSFEEKTATQHWTMDGKATMDWADTYYEADGLGLGYKADLERTEGPHRDAPFAVAFPSYTRTTETWCFRMAVQGFTFREKILIRLWAESNTGGTPRLKKGSLSPRRRAAPLPASFHSRSRLASKRRCTTCQRKGCSYGPPVPIAAIRGASPLSSRQSQHRPMIMFVVARATQKKGTLTARSPISMKH